MYVKLLQVGLESATLHFRQLPHQLSYMYMHMYLIYTCTCTCMYQVSLAVYMCTLDTPLQSSPPHAFIEQLNKIDEDIKRSLTDKLTILQSMQGLAGDRATLRRRGGAETRDAESETLSDPRHYVAIAIEQGGQEHLLDPCVSSSAFMYIYIKHSGSHCVYKAGWCVRQVTMYAYSLLMGAKLETALSRDCWLVWPHHDSFFRVHVHVCDFSITAQCIKCETYCTLYVAGEVASTLSHVMVTNPTRNILAETQSRLADIITETQRNLSKLMLSLEKRETRSEE